jgi:hypothetical protein
LNAPLLSGRVGWGQADEARYDLVGEELDLIWCQGTKCARVTVSLSGRVRVGVRVSAGLLLGALNVNLISYLRREQSVSLEAIKAAVRPLIAGLLSSSGPLL